MSIFDVFVSFTYFKKDKNNFSSYLLNKGTSENWKLKTEFLHSELHRYISPLRASSPCSWPCWVSQHVFLLPVSVTLALLVMWGIGIGDTTATFAWLGLLQSPILFCLGRLQVLVTQGSALLLISVWHWFELTLSPETVLSSAWGLLTRSDSSVGWLDTSLLLLLSPLLTGGAGGLPRGLGIPLTPLLATALILSLDWLWAGPLEILVCFKLMPLLDLL